MVVHLETNIKMRKDEKDMFSTHLFAVVSFVYRIWLKHTLKCAVTKPHKILSS